MQRMKFEKLSEKMKPNQHVFVIGKPKEGKAGAMKQFIKLVDPTGYFTWE